MKIIFSLLFVCMAFSSPVIADTAMGNNMNNDYETNPDQEPDCE